LENAAVSAAHDVGWVYRADDELPPVDLQQTAAKAADEVHHVSAGLASEPADAKPDAHDSPNTMSVAMLTGMSVLAIGIITTGLATLAAFTLITAPMRLARRYLSAN
jgi:hypothetical protein